MVCWQDFSGVLVCDKVPLSERLSRLLCHMFVTHICHKYVMPRGKAVANLSATPLVK